MLLQLRTACCGACQLRASFFCCFGRAVLSYWRFAVLAAGTRRHRDPLGRFVHFLVFDVSRSLAHPGRHLHCEHPVPPRRPSGEFQCFLSAFRKVDQSAFSACNWPDPYLARGCFRSLSLIPRPRPPFCCQHGAPALAWTHQMLLEMPEEVECRMTNERKRVLFIPCALHFLPAASLFSASLCN